MIFASCGANINVSIQPKIRDEILEDSIHPVTAALRI